MQPHKPLNTVKESELNSPSSAGYTDFSGVWDSPKCKGMPMTLKIENSSNQFSVDEGEPMAIGTMTTNTNSGIKRHSSILTNNVTSSIEWNAEKTQLILKQIEISKEFTDDVNPNPADDVRMHVDMTHVTFELDNERLKIKFNTAEYIDLQQVDVSQPTCVFTKRVNN
jgi:hypothetical protein